MVIFHELIRSERAGGVGVGGKKRKRGRGREGRHTHRERASAHSCHFFLQLHPERDSQCSTTPSFLVTGLTIEMAARPSSSPAEEPRPWSSGWSRPLQSCVFRLRTPGGRWWLKQSFGNYGNQLPFQLCSCHLLSKAVLCAHWGFALKWLYSVLLILHLVRIPPSTREIQVPEVDKYLGSAVSTWFLVYYS